MNRLLTVVPKTPDHTDSNRARIVGNRFRRGQFYARTVAAQDPKDRPAIATIQIGHDSFHILVPICGSCRQVVAK